MVRLGIFAGGRTAEAGTTRESAERILKSALELGHDARILDLPPRGYRPLTDDVRELDIAYPLVAGLEPFFEFAGLPYIGSEPTAAGLAANKGLFNDLVSAWGYEQPRYIRVAPQQDPVDAGADQLTYPVFVKPARLGASIGISRVEGPADLPDAMERARSHDLAVVVEEAVVGVEVNVAVVAGREVLQSPPAAAIVPPDATFLDMRAKVRGLDFDATAVPEAVREELAAIVDAITMRLGLGGALTHEHFVTPDGRVLVGEVNCLPGQMERSGYPRLFEAAGITREQQLAQLIDAALWHHEQARSNASRY